LMWQHLMEICFLFMKTLLCMFQEDIR
jgi:hypothetical protein